ncbi:hypothetical protein GW742_23575 [Citrobacter freundii]|nr:hypothetical protein [Citrobacter freundii]MBC6509449.1 hypothetical protein [Citrobacter freundii]
MGKMKELLFEMQEERADKWIAENYPDAEEGTPEWNAAAQEYSWFRDWMEEAAEQQYFEASLASIPDRLQDANDELFELENLMQFNQPRIVERMAYVHCVSVLDSFLMYSARALLNHPPHLRIFLQAADSLIPNKEDRRKLRASKWVEQEPDTDTPEKVYTWRAQSLVAKKTFQSHKVISRYFSTMLTTPHEWPLQELEGVIKVRNALVHRNGVTEYLEPVYISSGSVQNAIRTVRAFITAAAETLLQEDALYRTDDGIF